jgi:hypothetical protein
MKRNAVVETKRPNGVRVVLELNFAGGYWVREYHGDGSQRALTSFGDYHSAIDWYNSVVRKENLKPISEDEMIDRFYFSQQRREEVK